MASSTPARNTRSRSREQHQNQEQQQPPTLQTNASTTGADPKRPSIGRRRKSSMLGGDPRGDTGGNSMTTTYATHAQLASPTYSSSRTSESGRKRRKSKTFFRRCVRICLKHTWLLPLVLTCIILTLYFISPGEQNPLYPAIFLSYADPPLNERTNTLPAHVGNVTQYGKGPKDIAFVAFYTIVLSFTREFMMQCVIKPIALWCNIRGRAKQSRFMEQFYTAIYFAILGPFGLYVMSRSPVWYFNTKGMYEGFPHRAHEGIFKTYYLLQASYWAQQALVLLLQLEAPRKDFKELVLHHVVTLSLIGLSYRFHFTYMGVAVYITHDISDFFLATSKILNYVDATITGGFFILFIGVWAYLRHYINIQILISLLPGGTFSTVGPFDLNWDTQQYKCWISQVITFGLLVLLQAVNIFWFVLILRILYRYLTTNVHEDMRSEGEDEEEDEQTKYKGDKASAPEVMVNGEPVAVEISGVDIAARGKDGISQRKQ
ncbi:longevity assurance proteins LAG1/LAC1 [Polychaeton citri CBS 116435]|uniref:Longevity assurance proteins LAG1/LAC1 n=1 Tax=Polychaeton citri CBS 116435 TaxID=1314669 RepID=A0A9P4QAJ2_9PEZI|nr:longevity assurance proteins LAG1/LAC1 [Polychaeton citri CBS 116435]